MDVDSEVDQELLFRLNTLGTRDKEDLVSQFRSIVGSQLSPGGCAFYLDMGNWNVQAALCAYYDVMASEKPAVVDLVDETNHKDENGVSPCQRFTKTWRLKNTGKEPWPDNMLLRFVKGHNLGHGSVVPVSSISPGETADVSIHMTAPSEKGLYTSHWRLITAFGAYCGDPLLVEVNVDDNNILKMTQQMTTTDRSDEEVSSLFAPSPSQPIATPARSPMASITATPYCSPTGYGIFGRTSPTSIGAFRNGFVPAVNESLLSQQFQSRTSPLCLGTTDADCMDSVEIHDSRQS